MRHKILFVCHGNICRSPMAEFVMKKLVRDAGLQHEYEIDSAATSLEEVGNDVYPPARSCMRSHGIPFERREARQITRADYDYYDRIFLMDNNNYAWLSRLMPDLVWRTPEGWADRDGKVSEVNVQPGVQVGLGDGGAVDLRLHHGAKHGVLQ